MGASSAVTGSTAPTSSGLRDESPNDLALDPGVEFGVRIGVLLCPCLLVEGELSLTPTSTRELGADVLVIGWRAQALWQFLRPTPQPVIPFALAGVGAMTSSPADERVLMLDTILVFHVGLGLKHPIRKDWGLRFDARALLPPSTDGRGLTIEFAGLLGIYADFEANPPQAGAALESSPARRWDDPQFGSCQTTSKNRPLGDSTGSRLTPRLG